MNTKNLQKHYGKLTAKERYAAMIAANLRDDVQECAALITSAPRKTWSVSTLCGLAEAFEMAERWHQMNQLGYAAALYFLIAHDGESDGEHADAKLTILRKILTEREIWRRVCGEYGLDADALLAKLPFSEVTYMAQRLAELLCGDDLKGRRDWIILGLLLGAGLRRDELARLTFDAMRRQPTKGGKVRDVLEVIGKGNKTRVIPIKPILADRLRKWRDEVGGGNIARSLTKGADKKIGKSLSAVGIFKIVAEYGAMIGIPELAPHDARRTYAQLGYEAGIPITQISVLLGHSTVAVTQKYLDLALDIETTISDFIPLAE
ncbi:MAG: site-specific integrase [Anaerolineales bacterium]|nr:site-specific integrase [Anaerolineales bacterium]